MATRSAKIDQKADLIWAIADKLTGVYKPHEYGDVILPLTVIRRFDCILSDTKDAVLQKYEEVKNLPMKDVLLRKAAEKDFYNTSKYTFERLMDDPDHIEENFRDYLNGFSANVQDILEKFKFDGHITTMANKGILYIVLKEYTTDRGNLHPNEISNLEMGYIFEEIIRRFSESHNEDAGQHYTPREVIQLMVGKLKASDVDNFTIYALKDEIIDGEEEISDELADKKKQDIHAKIYLRRKYSDVDLYLGSMNASYSAINKNVEMMLWLGTKNMYLNGDKFLEDIFCGPVGDAKNPFEQVTVADAVLETESDNRNLLEQKIKDLCRVKRQAVISEDNENAGKYKIEVEFSGIESDSEVTVSPFNSKQEQTLSEHIEFLELEILQLSEFYEITARSGDDTIRRIIMIPTSGFPDDRESAAVNSVVKDRASFVEYIAFVLGDDYVASMLEGKQMGESGFFANSSDAMPALYEKMLKTSVEEPERIKDIGYVLKMVTDKDIIPDEFRELYETFCNTLKIRR